VIASSFDQSNCAIGRPAGMTDEQCSPLSVYRGSYADNTPVVISCWKLTKEEQEEFQRTGRIWLTVLGHTMPPVCLSGQNPFAEAIA